MIYRLIYCNKDGVEARVDIQKGSATPIVEVEGTATPFALNYKMDKPDKSGFFMTSSADISIFETTSFNIDSLKTSSETEIKVEHYINGILDWAGFVIPDFFSKTIGSPATVEMVASDRLATLKGVTLTDLNQYTSMRDLAVACLAHTGLSLPLYTLADFGNDGQTNAFFKALGLSSRLSDTKGRNISCYDILKSILVASNSKLVQQDGAWHIVNKWQHEQGAGNIFSNLTSSTPYSEQTINFSDVHVGGRRSIVPVAAITGVYHEFGGGRSYPDNFDFRDFVLTPEFNFPDWTKGGTFNVSRGNKEIIGYSFDGQMQFGTNTVDNYFFNSNVFNTSNYLQMDGVPVPYATGQIEVVLDLNATAQTVSQFLTNVTAVKIAVGAVKDGSPTIWLNNNGIFAEDNAVIHNLNFERGATYQAQTKGFNLKGVINNPEGYSIIMRIYGSRDEGEDNRRQIAIHFARIEFKNTQDAPKGTIYKRKQGTDFTKEHDIDTTIFGDYMQKGLDGYFYEYPFDDTSSLYRTAGTLTQPLWTAPNDTEQLPLLQHVTRQKSRMFSLAHNMISARINVSSFKPLNIFIDCNSERHVIVSATYDFLRSEVEVELEQIASTTLNVRDFIYSYFGDGESGIKSVGGISGGGGGGGTGGGLTPEQIEILSWWKKDPDNPDTIFTEMKAYSTKELSAYGVGDGGGGGGSDYERLDTWASYDSSKAGWVLSAFLGNDLNTRVTAIDGRVTDLENSAGSGSVTSVGISVPTGLSVSNSPITSSGVIAIGLQTGYSIPTTVKQGQWDTAFNNNHTHSNKTVLDGITSTEVTNWNTAFANSHTHANKTQLDLITQSNIDVLARLSIVNGNLQINGNAYATGEVSAYGVGDGGGSGGGIIETVYGYSNLGQTFNNANLTDTFNAYTINQINTRLVSVESGSALTVNTTGTGNAITSISKAGSVITANKNLTFLETSIFNTHNNDNVRHITGAERTKWDGVVTDFGNLEIGGRNYISGNGDHIIRNSRFINIPITVPLSGQLTLSASRSIVQGAAAYSLGRLLDSAGNAIQASPVPAIRDEGFSSITFSISTLAYTLQIYAGIDFAGSNGVYVDLTKLKLEKGTIATDWTPAPEDQVSDWLTTDVNSFSFIKNKPTTLAGYGIIDATQRAGVGGTANSILSRDTRSVDEIPNTDRAGGMWLDFKSSSAIGLTGLGQGAFSGVLTILPYGDATGNSISGGRIALSNGNLYAQKANATDYANWNKLAFITDNVASATKLQTPRTIWGQSFDGTGNVTGAITSNYWHLNDSATNPFLRLTRAGQDWYVQAVTAGVALGATLSNSILVTSVGDVGIGTTSPSEKLHVVGNILATGTTATTKVIFNSAGWSMEQTGTELLLKYNNVVAQRFLSDGSIVGLGEITAYGATTGGEGVSLLRTGGTMTGPIRWETQNSKTPFIGHSASDGTFTIAIDDTTWQSGLSLGGASGNLLWKGSQVLDKANTANKIEMGNGWTIEQTTSALTIKKNGVIKGTFNA